MEKSELGRLRFSGWRCVEDQWHSVTLNLVDSLSEHDILEEEIENAKPSVPKTSCHLHYLLSTPFRYKTARWGSRFGTTNEPSIFYGALEEVTALAETAYYQLRFFHASKGKFHAVTKGFCTFDVQVESSRGFDLTAIEFHDYHAELTSVDSYSKTHEVGTCLRKKGVEALLFWSARCDGKNFALFSPSPIIEASSLKSKIRWEASVTTDRVIFSRRMNNQNVEFSTKKFAINGVFPAIPS